VRALPAELGHHLLFERNTDDVAPAQAQPSEESMCRESGRSALAGVIRAKHAEQLAQGL
jgi:hypothetical protein